MSGQCVTCVYYARGYSARGFCRRYPPSKEGWPVTAWRDWCGEHKEAVMDFGKALELVKAGQRVARQGWNGKNMFIFLVPGSTFQVNRPPLLGIYPEGTTINYHAHIDMRTADGQVVPWLCSQTDMLAEDWTVVG